MISSGSEPRVEEEPKNPRRAAAAAFLGSALEYYDFFIYGAAAALVFGPLFFPEASPATATIASLATFGVGYLARPLGGLLWGHVGDRIGRKKTLIYTLLLMGSASFAIGCLPTYDHIGIAAPMLLVVLRLLQGLSAGGEAAGAGALTLEHSPEGRRGFFTSFLMTGYAFGTLLGTAVFIPLAAMGDEALYSWGWRVPFLSSVVVLALAYWVRTRLDEGEAFKKIEESGEVEQFPLAEVFQTQWKDVLRVLFTCLFGVVNTIITVFGLSYATSEAVGIPRATMLTVSTTSLAVSILVIPMMAILSDRIGRRPVLIGGSIGSIVSVYLFFWSISVGSVPLIFGSSILTISFFFSCYAGVYPSFFAEMFASPVRYSGSAAGSQLGLLVAGFSPTIAQLLAVSAADWVPVATFTGVCTAVAGVAVWSARETAKTPLLDLGVPARSRVSAASAMPQES